jgi:LPS O-antigen subunit length determinant protein (WzzB/FepE family)
VSIQGNSPEAMSAYLNSLVDLANSKTINKIIKRNELKISNRLEEISLERDLLLEQAQIDRFSQIERIKEEDAQKIRQIIDQIDRARYQAKQNRLNQIVILTDSAKLAKSLRIIENNFKLIKGDGDNSDLTIAIGENKDLPEWYLFGEKALLQRVELLQNRTSDDPFISELVTLNNQLNEVQNNNALKTLEMRQDDSPYIAQIAELEVEKIKLESRIVEIIGVSSMQLSQLALTPKEPIKPNKRLIVLLAFIGSFMMSILLALIMGVLKSDEKTPTYS